MRMASLIVADCVGSTSDLRCKGRGGRKGPRRRRTEEEEKEGRHRRSFRGRNTLEQGGGEGEVEGGGRCQVEGEEEGVRGGGG